MIGCGCCKGAVVVVGGPEVGGCVCRWFWVGMDGSSIWLFGIVWAFGSVALLGTVDVVVGWKVTAVLVHTAVA